MLTCVASLCKKAEVDEEEVGVSDVKQRQLQQQQRSNDNNNKEIPEKTVVVFYYFFI